MTRIGLDVGALVQPGSDRGLGRYTVEIRAAAQKIRGVEVVPVSTSHYRVPANPFLDHVLTLGQLRKVSLFHSTTVTHLPLIKTRPWVCSIQDIIPLDLDGYTKRGVKTDFYHSQATRCDVVVANSTYTAGRIADRLGVAPGKIVTAPIPVSAAFRRGPSGQPESPVAYACALVDQRSRDDRKRYHWIQQIAKQLRKSGIQVRIAGRGIREHEFPDCTVVGELSDAGLRDLYSASICFIYPSAYEGQGLPPVEAMACGCPVLAFRNTAVEEMVGLEEFLVDDPVPWAEQDLAGSMPRDAVCHFADKVVNLVEDRDRLSEYRRIALVQARKLSDRTLAEALARSYRLASGA